MPRQMDRRSFLKLAGLASGAAALPLVSPAIGLASLERSLMAAQQTRMLMGTLVSVTVLDPSGARAQEAMDSAFAAMTRLTPLFDRHSPAGALAILNNQGSLRDLTPQLKEVLALCQQVRQATGGAFDPTVAPLVDAMAQSFQVHKRPPARAGLKAVLKAVGGVAYDGQTLRLTKDGAGLTLDGVAKGYIVDQGLAAIRATGAKHALINAGGDVGVLGDRGARRPWRVAISDPASPTRPKAVIKLTSGAVATSGDYEVYFDRERLYHHIVNPVTGRSPVSHTSASVRAPSAAMADALSTACFVMPPQRARAFLAQRQGLEGMILTRRGQRYQTPGFVG